MTKTEKCYYCGRKVSMDEITTVDRLLGGLNEDDYEHITDNLPETDNPREEPYTHMTNLGYRVTNMCKRHINQK